MRRPWWAPLFYDQAGDIRFLSRWWCSWCHELCRGMGETRREALHSARLCRKLAR